MRLLAGLVLLAGCGGGLSAESKADLHNAAVVSAMAYRYQDAGTPGAALVRGSHCAVQAVLRNEGLGPIDSGIGCGP